MKDYVVDFHILTGKATIKERNLYLCAVVDKAYREGKKVFIVADANAATEIDQQLWTFRDIGFVPHAPVRDVKLAAKAPILIGSMDELQGREVDVAINLTDHALSMLGCAATLVEIVCDTEESKELSRKKVREYRAQGVKINYFK